MIRFHQYSLDWQYQLDYGSLLDRPFRPRIITKHRFVQEQWTDRSHFARQK